MIFKRISKAFLRILLLIIAIELLACIVLAVMIHVYGQTEQVREADAIIVLGAGLRYDGRPGPALIRRSRHAAALYHQGYAERVICTGGTALGRARSEAEACRDVLIEEGVPDSAILLETNSRSTEENAIYTHQLMERNGWRTAVLVSDAFHLLRAQWIFTNEGITVYPSPTVNPPIPTYLFSVGREIAALHWQVLKQVLRLPFTHIPSL